MEALPEVSYRSLCIVLQLCQVTVGSTPSARREVGKEVFSKHQLTVLTDRDM
jgi:hypothetical protein